MQVDPKKIRDSSEGNRAEGERMRGETSRDQPLPWREEMESFLSEGER